jgi:site-specific DNA-adenine methylase
LNDLDELLVKTFLEIKNNVDTLLVELDKTNISSETLFDMHVLRKDNKAETDLNRVISYLYCKFYSLPMRETGFNCAFRNSHSDLRGIAINNFDKLKDIVKYLQNCILNNRTFDNFLRTIKNNISKGENMLLFIDPPYLNTKSSSSNQDYNNFNEEDMKRLLNYLDEHCKIPFIFCHFPHPLIEDWALRNNHTINKFKKPSNCSNIVNIKNIHKDKEEWFITNYTEFYTNTNIC